VSTLNQIVDDQTAEVPELPRLPVADTFIAFNRMGVSLDNARESFKKIPETASRDQVTAHLKDIVKFCAATIKTAERLLEANK
jgi:hypothetical protein